GVVQYLVRQFRGAVQVDGEAAHEDSLDSGPLGRQTGGNDEGCEQGYQTGDGEGPGRAQALPAVTGIQRAKRTADAGQADIERLGLALLAVGEAALHEVDTGGMEGAEGRGV